MKSQRLSSKDYEDLLKVCRRWPQPYLGIVAKLISHLSWQFEEITRLKARLDKLEQPELLNEEQKLIGAFPGSQIKKPSDPMPSTKKPPKVYTTPAERLNYIKETSGVGSPEWNRTLKYKGLTNEDALKLIQTIK